MGQLGDRAGEEPSFRELADALGLGMPFQVLAPPDGQGRTFTYVGDSCREMTGVEPAEAMADASKLYGRILPEHLEALAAREAEALAKMQTFDMEVRMLGANGDVRWRRIVSTPRRQADGSTLWDGLMSDVTEQRQAEAELQEQRRRLQSAVDATGLGLWEWDVPGGALTWSDRNRALFGLPPGEPVSIQRYLDLVHPEDRDGIREVYSAAAAKPEGGDFLLEHRTAYQPEGKVRWLQSRGRVVKDAGGIKLVVGATIDITERKAAEERRTLLMSELAHRAKNGILVMMAIVAQTARGVQTVQDFEAVLTARLKAMADSQDLVTASGGRPVQLADVVATTLTPFDASRFDVDDSLAEVTVAGEVAVALGLLLHELSTNAVKYGALSKPAGRVAIRRDAGGGDGETVLKWTERGGPEVIVGKRKGFGSRLLDVALRPQGGRVEAAFDPKGFRADIAFPNAHAAQQTPKQ